MATLESRKPPSTHSDLESVSRIGGMLPWLAVLAVLLSGLYVRVAFGRWPLVYRDSPKGLLTGVAAVVAAIIALACPAVVTVAVLLPIVRLAYRARPVFNGWVLSSFVGSIALYLLVKTDPYGFLEWAFD